jgi:hypothetical protein
MYSRGYILILIFTIIPLVFCLGFKLSMDIILTIWAFLGVISFLIIMKTKT